MGLFPPGKGGGDGVAYGGKGKGVLIHTFTEGNGMPLANCTTAAQSRMAQVAPQKRRLLASQAAVMKENRSHTIIGSCKGQNE